MRSFTFSAAVAALASTALAQTWTSCNPLNTTCAPDTALGVSNYSIDLQKSTMTSRVWNATAGSVDYEPEGALFTINERGDAPTVQSNFYIFFGQVEVHMLAAAGQGIVSSIVLESNDLDEIDWEWIGGNDSYVQTNYFGKGNTTDYNRAKWYPVETPQSIMHNYTTDWSEEAINWYIDGQIIRTLNYSDANGGHNFPQTPCNVRIGIWAGGDPDNSPGTIEWAGGKVDYSKAPFTQTVQYVRVSDASTGTQYEYVGDSGSYESIKSLNTTKALELDGNNGGNVSTDIRQKWTGLSKNAKIAVACSVLGSVAIFACVFAFCCIKQRRAGKHEKLLEDAKFEKDRSELLAYRAEMSRQRSEKLVMMREAGPNGTYGYSPSGTPRMGNVGASFISQPGSRNVSGGRSYHRY